MLEKIQLINFRNYKNNKFEFGSGINVVCGQNAAGKTNLLEAIYLISVGDSFRAKRTEEMVAFGEELGRVAGVVKLTKDDKLELEVLVNGGVVMGKQVNKRKYLVGGVSRRKADLMGMLPVVLFRPEDVELISGSPEWRRKFMDKLLVQTDKEYHHHLFNYEQGLKRRNKILDQIREGIATRYSLAFWDGLLIKHGEQIQRIRRGFIDFLNDLFGRSELFKEVKIEYDLSSMTAARLEQYRDVEVALGYTLVGPHKDDLFVKDGARNLSTYGSRGEQRMAVLACKVGEIYYLEKMTGKTVLLLLDDIFSELDGSHKEEVLRVMQGRQVVVTTADESDLDLFNGAQVVKLTSQTSD